MVVYYMVACSFSALHPALSQVQHIRALRSGKIEMRIQDTVSLLLLSLIFRGGSLIFV